ncbi:flavin-containing monooxygenase FMO GS-OX-like 2 isoform X2 [Asparagus officinalis]|uniref:flavin-containing monooxygenase FMO GS-OX-like 2 isoform X2 n=1 Tax=Asparagus officinalis TaxID=4686 RepID=UPI00098DF509|nr:flavin-containing monooxygenase FMO GS-OX-like 2 isoform X2 [Asparagus officinalis]
MGFTDRPFPGPTESSVDPRLFPAHEEVLGFIERFAEETGVVGLVRFGAEVGRVEMGRRKDEWVVEARGEGGEVMVEVFEAVVVCNGHHGVPRFAEIDVCAGIEKWPGKQVHSYSYRIPEPFQDQILVIIGKGASAHDISRELSKVAKEVHLASRSPDFKVGKLDGYNNIWQHLMIKNVNEDGLVVFDDGSSLHADTILHCTGYKYHFPFLDTKETVSVDDNRVGPLYKHVFPPHLAPYLSFVGLLSKVIIFMSIDLQAKWVARVLSGKISLPPEDEMVASMDEYYFQMEEIGKPKRHTHELYPDEVEHLNWLTAEVGLPPLEDWRFQIYRTVLRRISAHDDNYRDNLDVDSLIQHSLPRVQILQ